MNCAAVPRMTKPAPCREKGVASVAHSVDFELGFRSGHRKGGAACLVSEHIHMDGTLGQWGTDCAMYNSSENIEWEQI